MLVVKSSAGVALRTEFKEPLKSDNKASNLGDQPWFKNLGLMSQEVLNRGNNNLTNFPSNFYFLSVA